MDEAFRDYYERRLRVHDLKFGLRYEVFAETLEAQAGLPQPDPVAEVAVQHALEGARVEADRRGLDLRPDAELVLLLLADELVAKPVAAVTPDEAPVLARVLRSDAEVLVSNAEASANDREISAHALIDSLSRSWADLQSAQFRIWDRAGSGPASPTAGSEESDRI